MGFAQPLADLTDHPLSGLRTMPLSKTWSSQSLGRNRTIWPVDEVTSHLLVCATSLWPSECLHQIPSAAWWVTW
jgi:hypothetical protein